MVWVTTDVEVDLDCFDDEDIRAEYESRGLTTFEDAEVLNKIWIADREGRKDVAYALMREYVLKKLGKVL